MTEIYRTDGSRLLSSLNSPKQMILDLFGRSQPVSDLVFSDIKLGGRRLPGLKAWRSKINQCSFKRTNLTDSNFVTSELQFCDFSHAKVVTSNWNMSNILKCNFVNSDLSKIDLWGAIIRQCDFRSVNLHSSELSYTVWQHVDLRGCDFTGCKFENSTFRYVKIDSEAITYISLMSPTVEFVDPIVVK